MSHDIAARLRQLRAAQDTTQDDVAAAIGVDRSMVTRMESGKKLGGRQTLMKLAEFYGVSLDWLVTGANPPPSPAPPSLPEAEAQLLDGFRRLPDEEARAFLALVIAASKSR